MLTRLRFVFVVVLGSCVVSLTVDSSHADGLIGRHFFPSTQSIDDPFVADELGFSLLHIKAPRPPENAPTLTTDLEAVYSKRLTESLGVSIGVGVLHLVPDDGSAETGFSNVSLQVKYEIVESAAHEALLSAALGWDIGGTGDRSIAPSFDVVTPSLFFAKGFGDLPDGLSLLKPLAVTGVLGTAIPTRTSSRAFDPASNTTTTRTHPNVFESGFAVEYSMPYLEEVVGLTAIPSPFNRTVPLVEVSVATPLDRGGGGKAFGTVNPGVAWLAAGNRFQLTLEAAIPINDRSGKTVGVRAGFSLFLNRLFPASRLFRPLFGE